MEFKEIVGVGYACDNLVYLSESVVNMWRGKPDGAYTYFARGYHHYLEIYVKVDETSHKTVLITDTNVTDNIKNLISEKYPETKNA